MEQKSETRLRYSVPIWTLQVQRWIVQIAILDWFSPSWNKKSNFGLQNVDLDWSKGTQPKLNNDSFGFEVFKPKLSLFIKYNNKLLLLLL